MQEIKTILFPVEFSTQSDAGLERVRFLAKKFNSKVVLLHVIPETPVFLLTSPQTERYLEIVKSKALDILEELRSQLADEGIEAESELREGKVYLEIVCAAKEKGADLIVMLRHGEYGSTVMKVVSKAHPPVYVVQNKPITGINSILFPTDLSGPAGFSWRYTVNLAEQLDAKITVIHVHEMPLHWQDIEAELQAYFPEYTELMGKEVEERSLNALRSIYRDDKVKIDYLVRVAPDAATEIVNVASQIGADLIVMATHGRTGLKKILLGSVTEKVVRISDVDLIVVRPPEFQVELSKK